jgi:DNA-binding NarL/FixJ family response regulator
MQTPNSDRIKVSVAIVEDQADLRKSLTTLIQHCSELQFVQACSTAEEAIKKIPALKPNVVLMDLHLSKTNGIECTRQLKAIVPEMHILMLTNEENDDDLVFRALRAGASGYLVKRLSMEKVLESIKSVHRGEVPISANIARKILATFREIPRAFDGVEKLTKREEEVLVLVSKGLKNKEIATKLDTESCTIETHLRNIFQKMSVHSRTEAVTKFMGWMRGKGNRIRERG